MNLHKCISIETDIFYSLNLIIYMDNEIKVWSSLMSIWILVFSCNLHLNLYNNRSEQDVNATIRKSVFSTFAVQYSKLIIKTFFFVILLTQGFI
jgi:hypothetical protein